MLASQQVSDAGAENPHDGSRPDEFPSVRREGTCNKDLQVPDCGHRPTAISVVEAIRLLESRKGYGRERIGQALAAERDVRQPTAVRLVEKTVEVGSSQIDVDERNPLARARERDGQIRGGCRFPLFLDGARDHDRADALIKAKEIETRAEHPEGLGLAVVCVVNHDELVVLSESAGWLRKPGEERKAKAVANFVGCSHPCI